MTGAGQVKMKVKWCGICGSDLHEYLGGPIFIPVDEPHPLTGEKAPVTLGHEFSGEVVEVGEGVSNYKIGESADSEHPPMISMANSMRVNGRRMTFIVYPSSKNLPR